MNKFSFLPNRTVCAVLEEMRKIHETRNYSYLLALIEEVQSLANRMEAALEDKRDVKRWNVEREKLKSEIKALHKEKAKLKGE